MKKLITGNWLLITIVFLACVLRFYNLATLPALNADEAAIGYNAYSLLQTGKDEHGNFWPIHFQSFNDYKPGLYFYIVLPFVWAFGLNEWAVRIPGAALGVGTILAAYFLVKELFPKEKNFKLSKIAALFLAISPWHLHFSRGGWEVNAATFFITFGVLGFIRGIKQEKWFLVSCVSFVASLYTYHAARVVVPLLVLGLVIFYRRNIFNLTPLHKGVRNALFLSGILGVVLTIPLVVDILGPAGISRAGGVGLFADTGPLSQINQQRGEHEDFQGLASKLLHNKAVNYGLAFLENYSEHFWGEFLFLSGDEIQRNKVPEMGQMYIVEVTFIVVGLVSIARNFQGWMPIILWLAVAPTAAALTFQSPHALRAHNMVVPLTVVSAFGFLELLRWIKKDVRFPIIRNSLFIILATLVAWDFTRYLHQYYFHMAQTYDYSSQYGVKEAIAYVKQNKQDGQKVVITNRYDQPYILFLFYLMYPPEQFQEEHAITPKDKFGFSTVEKFSDFEFKEIGVWDKTREESPGALIVGTGEEIPQEANVLKDIYFLSGRVAFRIVQN